MFQVVFCKAKRQQVRGRRRYHPAVVWRLHHYGDGFVLAAAIDLPRGLRINAVSPGLLEESAKKYEGFFPGHQPVSSARVGLAYAKSVEGALTGKVISID